MSKRTTRGWIAVAVAVVVAASWIRLAVVVKGQDPAQGRAYVEKASREAREGQGEADLAQLCADAVEQLVIVREAQEAMITVLVGMAADLEQRIEALEAQDE